MGTAIETLFDEHRRIERVLSALERWAAAGGVAAEDARERLAEWARFFREFADRAHHGKEEEWLFRTLRDHGVLPQCGPVNRFLNEHSQGRARSASLEALSRGVGPLTPYERSAAKGIVAELCELLRAHIRREDAELLPAAARELPADALRDLDEAFEAFDRETFGPGGYTRLVELADRLSVSSGEDDHGAEGSST